jgi:flagellar hook-associated protein 1 FlgK
MSGLFESLSSATSGLTAARLGLDVAGQNLANVNTVGYSRRTLVLADQPPGDALSPGRGVSVVTIQAMRDTFVNTRLRTEVTGGAYDAAVLDGMTEVESAVGLPGESLDADIAAFFDSFATLAQDPTSISARDAVIGQGTSLSAAFRTMTERFMAARRNADASIASAADEINQLAAEVAELNTQIVAGGFDVESLRDRRDVAISRLSELAGVTATTNSEGGVDLAIGSGRPLVVSGSAYAVTTSTSGPLGFTSLSIGGYDITEEVAGGRVGGLLAVRDTLVPGYQTSLDQMAYDFATAVNTAHSAGFDATGAPGGAFFAPLAGVAGAAAAIDVDAALASDGALVAASGTGAIGDNAAARAISALRDARVVNGNSATAAGAWGQIAFRVGSDVRGAQASSDTHDAVTRQLQRLRDQTSGVSVDEEAANLMRFQRSYEASARYFTTIVDTLDTLMNMVR